MHYEHHTQPLLSRRAFFIRWARHGVWAFALIVLSLLIGMIGYRTFAGCGWVDAFLNASMLLGGMGPVGELPTTSAKLFAGAYALYSGIVFLAIAALLLTPVFHRLLHRFHLEQSKSN